ncbi:MAG: histidine phosphatase family protein [Desulfovermiculus sp.]
MLPYALHEPKKRLLLIRHGQAGDQLIKRYIGQMDTRLTSQGQRRIQALARALAPVPLERIVCSDLTRCVQTAGMLAKAHGLAPEPHADLREICLGAWEGLPMDQVKKNDPEAFAQRGRDMAGYRPPGGESFSDLLARVLPVFSALMAEATGSVAIVSHAGVNRVILCHWLGLGVDKVFYFGQDPGCLNIVQPNSRDGIRLVAHNVVFMDNSRKRS